MSITEEIRDQYLLGKEYFDYIRSLVSLLKVDRHFFLKNESISLSELMVHIIGEKIPYDDYTSTDISNYVLYFDNVECEFKSLKIKNIYHEISFSEQIIGIHDKILLHVTDDGEYNMEKSYYHGDGNITGEKIKEFKDHISLLKTSGSIPESLWDFDDEHWTMLKLSS